MITEIVVGILVLWTLYAEIQRYQVRKLMVENLEYMEGRISELERQQDAMWEHGSRFWSGGKAS